MGKKKGSKQTAASCAAKPAVPMATPLDPHNDPLLAVIEFHHMLIGPSHKKEAAAMSAAAAYGIAGYLYMGGPSVAIVAAPTLHDLTGWLSDCKKAGKEGHVAYWQVKQQSSCNWNATKLKPMAYAAGKDTKMDAVAYQAMLKELDIPFPLPPCAPLF